MKKIIEFTTGLHRQIAHIKRFSTTPLAIKESVAEHSYFVAHYARLLADWLEQEKKYKIDKLQVVDMALIHDNEECWSGDIVYMVKRESQRISDVMDDISSTAIRMVLKPLGKKLGTKWLEHWFLYHHGNTIEKQIVMVADMMSLLTFILEQLTMGNQYVKIILTRVLERWRKYSIGKDEWIKELLDEFTKTIYLKVKNLPVKKGKEKEYYTKDLWGKEQ